MAPRKATAIGRRSLALVALPRFSCKTTCYGVCLVLVELGVTIVFFSLYGVSQVHQSLYLVCSVISAVSIWGGIFGLCRSTPSAIASLIVAIAVTFAFVLLGGLCIVLSLDVHSAVATALNKSLMPVPQNANKKLVRDTKIYLALAASALLVSAGCHALLARHLTRLVGPRRGTIAFLQTFSLLVIPFSLFLVLGGQYIADSGTLASAPYTSLIIFGSGVLLLAIAVLAFIGGTFEYRRLLSLCMMFSYVTAALLVGLSIAYVAMRSRVDDYIVSHWELVRVILPPTYQARYDQRQFVALVQSTLQTVAYVAIVCGLFVFQTAGVCASLMTHATAVKRQIAHDKQSMRGLEAQGNGADGEVASSSANPQVLQRHAWRQYFEASERRQRIAMRLCAFLFAVAVALILAVMSANVVFATKCHSIGKLVQEHNDTLSVSPNTTNGTAVSTLAITNRFASGMLTVRAATTKGNGFVRLEQYGNAERSKHESYVQSINGSTLTVDARPFGVTRFLWLDGSCQRSVMDVGIPTDAARVLHVHSNTSVDVRGGANGPSLTVSQLTVETDQANINASQLLVLDGGLALVSGSGEIDLSDTTVDGSRSVGIDTRAAAFAALGSLRADNVTFQDCDATLKTGAGTIEASRVFATATAGRSHLRLASTSGTIYAEQVRANWLELTTTNGAIAATALRTTGTSAFMGRLEVASVAGDITLQQVEPRGSVRVETSSGNVKLQLQTLAFTGLYFLHSDFGNVTIRIGLYGTDVIQPMRATASGGGLDKQGGVNCEPTNTSCLSYGELYVRSRLGDIEVVLGCDSFQCTSQFPLEMARGVRRPLAHFLGVFALLVAISVVALAAATDRDALVARLGLNHAALARVRVQPTGAADMARVRVLCWVNTFHGNHEKRLRTIQRTWGKKCDKLLFMSDVEDLSIPTVRIMAPPLHETLWQKHREIVRMLVREYTEGDFDWILKCDDDTFVIMENLKQLLLSSLVRNLPRDEPAILGHRMTLQWWEMQRPMEPYAEHDPLNILELLRVKAATSSHGGLYYTPGGGGYLMNWAYIKKLEASFDEHYCLPNEVVPDDWAISFCMLHHNVTPIDTRDDRQRERFHQYNTSMLYHTAHDDEAYDHAIYESIYEENNWFSDHNGIGWKNGDDCCAPDSITFHYVKPPLMELFHEYYYGKPE